MSLSMHGETLFHFTGSIDVIQQILDKGAFKARYCLERLVYEGDNCEKPLTPYLMVPMVSFCDYKLAEISHHALNYGDYALGMTKTWGVNNGLNPVLYVSKKFGEIRNLIKIMRDASRAIDDENGNSANKKILQDTQINVSNILAWTKNYQGSLNRKGVIIEDFRFADDKEWRYVATQRDISKSSDNTLSKWIFSTIGRMRVYPLPNPNCTCCGNTILNCVDRSRFWIRRRRKIAKKYLDKSSIYLRFNESDVRFIIVKSNEDRLALIDFFISKYISDISSVAYMSSKIIIKDDLDLRELKQID